jgi:hypothetical protein
VTKDTHPALVTQDLFDKAQRFLGKKDFRQYENVRKSVFSGLIFCELCGHALCSAGTVYKGEREKYWYLTCTHKRKDIANPCPGVRIKYSELVEMTLQEFNTILSLSENKRKQLISRAAAKSGHGASRQSKLSRIEKAKSRIASIDKIIIKLYRDNAEGKIDDDRLTRMVRELDKETQGLNKTIAEAETVSDDTGKIAEGYRNLFEVVSGYGRIEKLNPEILQTFIERIEIGPKVKSTQQVNVLYKFVGNIGFAGELSDAS